MIGNDYKEDDIPMICANCIHSTELTSMEYFICDKKGVVEPTDSCKKYKFDIFKYKPHKS
jgi:hypothetical protein